MSQTAFAPANRQKAYRFASVRHQAEKGNVSRLMEVIERQAARITQLEQLAAHDGLTGVLNRLGMDRELNRAVYDFERYGYGAAVLMIDLNGFKPINDTFGHAAGDAVLCHVARLLHGSVRASDMVARVGGDEFMLLLRESNMAGAEAKMAALARLIADTPCRYMGMKIWVTASMGAAVLGEAKDIADVVDLADARMYSQKVETGR